MNLIVDIGNTAVKVAVMGADNSLFEFSRTSDICTNLINNLISSYGIKSSIWLSSRSIDDKTDSFLSSMTPFSIHFKSGVTPIPLVNCYKIPKQLGADRLALAIGVHRRLPDKNCLIFDFGTALTIDFVDADGNFLGGRISPGLQMRFASLHEHTGLLPLIKTDMMDVEDVHFPTSTNEAIFSGVFRSMLYEVEGYLREYSGAEVVFSGYDAKYFVDKFKITIFAQYDDLLLEGLNSVLENCKSTESV